MLLHGLLGVVRWEGPNAQLSFADEASQSAKWTGYWQVSFMFAEVRGFRDFDT